MKKELVCTSILALVVLLGALLPAIVANPDYSLNTRGEVLVQGAPIRGSNGIYFDSNDQLHIASINENAIIVMNPDSGAILRRINASVPDDLTFGPDGSLYYTSIMTGYVYRIKPNGNITSQRVALGVNPITFSSDGRLFVALDFMGDGLYEVDPELVAAPTKLNGNVSLGYLNAMDFGPDGLLYGPSWTQARVVRINVSATPFAVTTVCDKEIGIPACVKFDSKGNLYMGDQRKGEISRINVTSGDKQVVATGLFGLDNLAFDSHDRLFVSNADDGSIHEVLAGGEKRLVSRGGTELPGGVAVGPGSDGGESVFVADTWGLREVDGLTGETKSTEYSYLNWPGSIISPKTVSVDGENLILTVRTGGTIQLWNYATGNGTTVGTRSNLNAIKFRDQIVVAQTAGVVWNSNGSSIAEVSGVATGLAAIGNDLYVAEWNSGIIWRIVDDGVPTKVQVATGLSRPEGLAVDLNGDLLVVESGAGRVSRINPASGTVSVVVEGLGIEATNTAAPGTAFNGIAVGSTGYIYVTGDTANVLYRLYPAQLPAGASDWSLFRHDLQHTGYSASPAPNTNQTLWTYTTGGYVSCSPAVVDGFVYVGSHDSKVYCLNAATGTVAWSYMAGAIVHSSPAVVDGRVYVGSGYWQTYGAVHCLNATTGTLIWFFPLGYNPVKWTAVFSSPAVVGGLVYFGSNNGAVYCLNATTGFQVWSVGISGGIIVSSPAVVGGLVYVGSESPDTRIYCLNATNGKAVWNYTTGGEVYSSPAVVGGRLYVGSNDRKIYCLNATTGTHIWNYTTGSYVDSSPAVTGGLVYVGSWDGKVYCLNATTGTLVWSYTTGAAQASSPAIAGGLAYIGFNDTKVYCLNAATGSLMWSYKTGGSVISSPAVANGVVYVGSWDGKVYAFSAAPPIPEFSAAAMILLFAILAAFAVFANKQQRRTGRFFSS